MKDRIISLASLSSSRAELFKMHLDNLGIECFLKNQNLIQGSVGASVKVRIHAKDLDRALSLAKDLKLNFLQDKDSIISEQTDINMLSHVSRILVPVDFSNFSQPLCDYALQVAKKFGSDILLFHTYFAAAVDTVPFSDSYTYNASVIEVLAKLEANAKMKLRELSYDMKNQLEKEKVDCVDVDFSLSGGMAELEILRICDTYKPDLIIMGSRGESSSDNNLFGSVVSGVVENVNSPILVLSDEGENIRLDDVKNIMYATNFDKSDYKAILSLNRIIKPYNMNIHCVHFEQDCSQELETIEKYKIEMLQEFVRENIDESKIICELVKGNNRKEEIDGYIFNNEIQMIAILARKHNLVEKLFANKMSRKLFLSTHIPILIMH